MNTYERSTETKKDMFIESLKKKNNITIEFRVYKRDYIIDFESLEKKRFPLLKKIYSWGRGLRTAAVYAFEHNAAFTNKII